MHGAVVVAFGGAPGAGEVFDAIGQVGFGIAQAFGVAGVADAARGRELDLHQPDGAAAPDQVGVICALAHDHPMHQRFRHPVRFGMNRDRLFIGRAILCSRLRRKQQRRRGGEPGNDGQTLHEKGLGGPGKP